ncbi:MAG: hypothetical protein KDC34_12410 [Saprospiraceae bacterium]|nr:hypothetical protein [Saprospiraceae bacterium]
MTKILQLSNIVGLLLVLTMNALANILPIAGYNTGELSDLHRYYCQFYYTVGRY